MWSAPNPRVVPGYEVGFLLFNGHLVKDYGGTPIKAFRNLPLTISSAVEGLRVEAWTREEPRLKLGDVIARIRTQASAGGRVPIRNERYLATQTKIFRIASGLRSWHERSGTQPAVNFMDSLRTDAERANNLATDHDLTEDELETYRSLTSNTPRRNAASRSTAAGPSSAPRRAGTEAVEAQGYGDGTDTDYGTDGEDFHDSREDVAETVQEATMLRQALVKTGQHFKEMTGQNPQKLKYYERNYLSCWDALQQQLDAWWEAHGENDAEGNKVPPPRLYKMDAWSGGITKWPRKWKAILGREWIKEAEADLEGHGNTYGSVPDPWVDSSLRSSP